MNIEVGDIVRVRESEIAKFTSTLQQMAVGKVEAVYPSYPYPIRVKFEGLDSRHYYQEEELEIVNGVDKKVEELKARVMKLEEMLEFIIKNFDVKEGEKKEEEEIKTFAQRGDYFSGEGHKNYYILSIVGSSPEKFLMALISLKSGYIYSQPVETVSVNVTKEEFDKITDERSERFTKVSRDEIFK